MNITYKTRLNDKKVRLYCELHITCEANGNFDDFVKLVEGYSPDWRCSRFDEDLVDNYHGKWFCSSKCFTINNIIEMLKNTVRYLTANGVEVIRWKAEDTLFDSKYGDKLEDIK